MITMTTEEEPSLLTQMKLKANIEGEGDRDCGIKSF